MKADKNLNKARKFLIREKNYSVKDAQKILDAIRHDLPNARLADCKFMLGLTRMYLNYEFYNGDCIMQMNSTIKLLASYHADEYDYNLNNEHAHTLIDRFSKIRVNKLTENKRKSLKKVFVKNDKYKIVRIVDAKAAANYKTFTSWCVAHSEEAYKNYTCDGIGVFYFCVREGFEYEREEKGECFPLDRYGLSMIAVSVDVYGECNTITCRWNHKNGGTDNVMTVDELEQLLGVNFYETFKPRPRTELVNILGKEGIELFDNGGEYIYRGGKVDEKINHLIKSVIVDDGVIEIADDVFRQMPFLFSVTLGNNVVKIGEGSFAYCRFLKSITIPNSVTSIGREAFCGCSSLTSIFIQDGNTMYDSRENCNAIIETDSNTLLRGCNSTVIPHTVTSIGDYAFWGYKGLTTITIPNSVTRIGRCAFDKCSGLTSVTIPNSVTSIGDYAFYGCDGLTSVTIPNSVTSVGHGTFNGCSGLISIDIQKENTKYDSRDNCNGIIETATNTLIFGCKSTIIPNSVTRIGEYAFGICKELKDVTIPNSVTSIKGYAFFGCDGLTSIIIPNSVTSLGKRAFAFCENLKTIIIPNSVTSIEDDAFIGCSSKLKIIYDGTVVDFQTIKNIIKNK